MRPYDVITFDCYGTLIDWERGIRDAFAGEAAKRGIPADLDEVLGLHGEIEAEVERERYRSYRAVLTETAARIAQRLGWPPGSNAFLADSLPHWPPFADTVPALEALVEEGYQLGILSNVDGDLLAGTLRHFTVEFEFLITAQDVHAYKPAPEHFQRARRQVVDRRWLHAAQSLYHDVRPACELGIPVVWINRRGEKGRTRIHPTGEVRDLAGLRDWLRAVP